MPPSYQYNEDDFDSNFACDKPPSDPLKPELPYRPGLSLAIRPHIPPPPSGISYPGGGTRPKQKWVELRNMTQSECCLRFPPAATPPPHDQTTRHLHVLDEIACEDGRGAQIVRCSFGEDAGEHSRVYVAKIYDALYYHNQHGAYRRPVDVTWKADRDYSSEAAAYEELKQAAVDGCLVPSYHGSWTFDMAHPAFPDNARPVRMILIGWVSKAVSMDRLLQRDSAVCVSPELRLEILAQAMEVICKLDFYGVRHEDFAPRNVMLIGVNEIEAGTPRVMLIDFNESTVFSQPNCKFRHHKTDLPISPKYYFWGQFPGDFYDWIPEPHRSASSVFKGWLKARWEHAVGFSGPHESMKEWYNFDEPVEFLPPSPDPVWPPYRLDWMDRYGN